MVHGALGCGATMDLLKDKLSNDFPQVEVLELPGHGVRAGEAQPYSRSLFRNALVETLEERFKVPPMIFGYSMGGYVALDVALHHPELVGRIVTLGTKLHWTPEVAEKETAMLDPNKIAAKVPQFAEHLARMHGEAHWKDVLHRTAAFMTSLGSGDCLTHSDLETIRIPVCLALGDRDNMVTLDETVAAYRALPNCALAVLPNTPHPLEKVEPGRISALLLG